MVETAVIDVDLDQSIVSTDSNEQTSPAVTDLSVADSRVAVIRTLPKSGRFWKEPKQRASVMKKHNRDSVVKKLKDRQDRKASKELTNRIKEELARQQQDKRERVAVSKKRKEENARKSEIVQTIKDTRKIKRMKKKQLRFIEKRDTTVVEMET